MKKALVALAALLAAMGMTVIPAASQVTSKTLDFKLNVPALGPNGTLAEFKHCDPSLADTNPATPQDETGCTTATVSGDTDAVLIMEVKTPSGTATAAASDSVTDPTVCPGQIGAKIALSGIVSGSTVKAIYDPTPATPTTDGTSLILNGPGASRSPFATVCV